MRLNYQHLIVLLLLVLMGVVSPALADEDKHASGAVNVAAAYNSLGLRIAAEYGYQWRLYAHDGPAFKDNFVRVRGQLDVSPASITPGVDLRLQPASFANLGVRYRYRLYLPAFSNGSFAGELDNARFDDKSFLDGEDVVLDIIEETEKRLGERSLYAAHLLTFYNTLQIKVGSLFAVVLTEFSLLKADLSDPASHRYYEPVWDIYIDESEQIFELLALVGYEFGPVSALLASSNTLALKDQSKSIILGPGILWKISDQWGGLKAPSLLLMVRAHLQHLWRTNSQLVPSVSAMLSADF